MRTKRWLIGGVVLAVVIGVPIAWYLISPLFITRTVDEQFPVAQVAEAARETQAPAPTSEMAEASTPMTSASQPAPSEPMAVLRGAFHDVAHEGTGTATIYRLENGRHVLRFENFEVLNGPDLHVWLSAAPDASDSRTILEAEYVELGRLKGNQGNQNYELPADLDLSQYHSVTIWCRRFSVNFATAPLQ